MKSSIKERFRIWDEGGYTYNEVEEKLLELKEGEKIKDILSECTVCPIGNATCEHYLTFKFVGFNPNKGYKKHEMMICGIGIEGDGEKCPLNK